MQARDLFTAPDPTVETVYSFLRDFGFRDPAAVDRHLQQAVEIVGDPEPLADAGEVILGEMSRSADPDAAASRFAGFLEHAPNPRNLVVLLNENPRVAEVLLGILGGSPFLAQILNRNPEYLYWLAERGRLDRFPEAAYFHRQAEELSLPFLEVVDALDSLRRLRRRETLRIGAQDLLGRSNMQQTVRQVSDLAEALIHRALLILARDRRLSEAAGFAVIALGKFGGRELNFSSDVDVLFVHADSADHAAMVRFGKELFRALTDFSSEGHLYRVDLRLRPMGSKGEIVYSESACRQYYQNWADTTDRLALIKARAVAGDPELGHRFVHSIQDFVFRRYLDYAAVEEIRWIKERSDEALRKRSAAATNIKLGFGGIREIEFFAQSFQILYAGQIPQLRTPNTLQALAQLLDHGFITSSDYCVLTDAYVFFRNLEHKLQLVHDLQTHSLPEDVESRLLCARRMGYTGPDGEAVSREFIEDLGRHTQAVHKIYRSLFEASRQRSDLEEIVLNSQLPESEALARLSRRQVVNPSRLLAGIRLLQEAPAFPLSPSRVRNLLANLVPALVEHLGRDADPWLSLTRFDRFCEALGSRASLYVEIVENPDFGQGLFRILRSGEFLADGLIRYPELLDTVFREDPPDRYLPALLSDPDVADGSPARRRDSMRRFKQREEFKLGVRELEAPGSPQRRRLLSELADACVQTAWRGMKHQFSHLDLSGAGLLALGKLGGMELSFHSDLDLVFLFDDAHGHRSAADFRDCLRFFREELQEYTAAGRAYEIDFRLRPEGRHTGEAIPLSQFIRYFGERAEAWERLAYAKARLLVAEEFEFDPASLVFGRAWSEEDRRELRRIRRRKELEIGREEELGEFDLKVGRGGLLDLQFVIQLLQVEHYITEPNILEANRLLSEIPELSGLLPVAQVQAHIEFCFALESCLYLMGRPPAKLSRDGTGLEAVSEALGEPHPAALLERYRHQAEQNRLLLDRVLGPEQDGP